MRACECVCACVCVCVCTCACVREQNAWPIMGLCMSVCVCISAHVHTHTQWMSVANEEVVCVLQFMLIVPMFQSCFDSCSFTQSHSHFLQHAHTHCVCPHTHFMCVYMWHVVTVSTSWTSWLVLLILLPYAPGGWRLSWRHPSPLWQSLSPASTVVSFSANWANASAQKIQCGGRSMTGMRLSSRSAPSPLPSATCSPLDRRAVGILCVEWYEGGGGGGSYSSVS